MIPRWVVGLGLIISMLAVMLATTGCGFAYKHPVQAKVYGIGTGLLIGFVVHEATKRGTCPGTVLYEGQIIHGYQGTPPCPPSVK